MRVSRVPRRQITIPGRWRRPDVKNRGAGKEDEERGGEKKTDRHKDRDRQTDGQTRQTCIIHTHTHTLLYHLQFIFFVYSSPLMEHRITTNQYPLKVLHIIPFSDVIFSTLFRFNSHYCTLFDDIWFNIFSTEQSEESRAGTQRGRGVDVILMLVTGM